MSAEDKNELLLKHFQHLFHDYEILQIEHSILRKEYNTEKAHNRVRIGGTDGGSKDNVLINKHNSDPNQLRQIIAEHENVINSLKNQVNELSESQKSSFQKYKDLAAIIGAQNGLSVIPKNDNKTKEYNELMDKYKKLQDELTEKEQKISDFDFINSENFTLQETIKEMEQSQIQERLEWAKEKKNFEEAFEYSKQLYPKYKELQEKIKSFESLSQFYSSFFDKLGELLFDKEFSTICEINDKTSTVIFNQEYADKIMEKVKLLTETSKEKNKEAIDSVNEEKLKKLDEEFANVQQEKKMLENENNELKNILKNKDNITSDNMKQLELIASLKAENEGQKEEYKVLLDKYIRHRQVFLNNESGYHKEIEKLDNFITNIFECLKKMPDNIKEAPEMKAFLHSYDEQMESEKNNSA